MAVLTNWALAGGQRFGEGGGRLRSGSFRPFFVNGKVRREGN